MGFSKRTKLGGEAATVRWATSAESVPQLPREAEVWWAPHRAWREAEAARTAEPTPPEERETATRLLEACQGGLLRSRVREHIDWGLVAASPPYRHRPFVSPLSPETPRQPQINVNAMLLWTLWAYLLVVLGVLLLLGRVWVPGVVLLLSGSAKLAHDYQKRKEGLAELAEADEAAMREAHEATEAEREAEQEARSALAAGCCCGGNGGHRAARRGAGNRARE